MHRYFRSTWRAALLNVALVLLAACGGGDQAGSTDAGDSGVAGPADAAALVRGLYFAKDHGAAARQGEVLVSRFPDSPELAAWHALSVARAGELDVAEARALELRERFPDDAWSLFAVASPMMWGRRPDPTEALEASAAALAASPGHPDFVWLRAESLRLRNRKAEAVAFLEEQPELLHAWPELLNVRAGSLFDMALNDPSDDEKRERAMTASTLARDSFPENVIAHFQPGWFLSVLDRPVEAYPLLKTAADMSRAPLVQSTYWGVILRRHDLTPDAQRAELDASISSLLDSPGASPDLLWRAARAYGEVGLHDKQRELEDRVLNDAPQGRAAENVLNDRIISMARDPDRDEARFRDALRVFIARDPIHVPVFLSQAQRGLFDSIKDDPDTDPAELLRLVRAMSQSPGAAKLVAHSEGAAALASRNVYLDEAEQLAKDGLALAPTPAGAGPDRGPEPTKGPGQPPVLETAMRDALGWVYFRQGRSEDAERELLAAYELRNDRPSVLLHLGELYESRGDFENAERYYLECAALPMDEMHPCANVLKDFYVRREGTEAGFDAYLGTIRDRLLAASATRVSEGRLSKPVTAPPFSLTSLDGRTVALDDLRGKHVIVKFWAVWCAPCRVEMPEFSDFAKRFEHAEDLAILTITLDPNPDTVRRWMAENDLTFDVLIDDEYAKPANVFSIPRTWFLDARGRKVYELHGVIPDLENEYVARLEFMRNEDG